MIRLVKYNEAEKLIQEGDILLFRGRLYHCIFPNIAWIVAKVGGGIHTHSGMASWSGNILECLEFRELKGGREHDRYRNARWWGKPCERSTSRQICLCPFGHADELHRLRVRWAVRGHVGDRFDHYESFTCLLYRFIR
jgi:hypothetical protein